MPEPTMTSYYMSLIGILMWIVELVIVDICLKVSVISLHMAIPREGHLAQLLLLFSHLEISNTKLVYDTSDPNTDKSKVQSRIELHQNLDM